MAGKIVGGTMIKSRVMIWLAIASYCWLVAAVLIGGAHYSHYSHISQFMSELGANGSPVGPYVNFLGFAITEVLLLFSLAIAWRLLTKRPANVLGFGLLAAYPVFIAIAAFSPCDFECRPDQPTMSHTVHIASGLFAYLCAILGLAILSWQTKDAKYAPSFRRAAIVLTPLLLIMLAALTPQNPVVGAVQRLAETMIYIWLLAWLYILAYPSLEPTHPDLG